MVERQTFVRRLHTPCASQIGREQKDAPHALRRGRQAKGPCIDRPCWCGCAEAPWVEAIASARGDVSHSAEQTGGLLAASVLALLLPSPSLLPLPPKLAAPQPSPPWVPDRSFVGMVRVKGQC